MNRHDHPGEMLPLYALDAIDGDERRRIEEHVAGCADCAAEVASYRSAASMLVADEPAPAHLWESVSAATVGDVTRFGAAPEGPSRWLRWVAAAAAVIAVVAGMVALRQTARLGVIEGPEGIVIAAESAAAGPGAVVSDFLVDGTPVARVVLSPTGEGFLVPEPELPPLDDGRTYQLWVVTPDEQVISAGVLGGDPGPSRFTWRGEVDGFALTREVAGGVVSSAGDVVSVAEG